MHALRQVVNALYAWINYKILMREIDVDEIVLDE